MNFRVIFGSKVPICNVTCQFFIRKMWSKELVGFKQLKDADDITIKFIKYFNI